MIFIIANLIPSLASAHLDGKTVQLSTEAVEVVEENTEGNGDLSTFILFVVIAFYILPLLNSNFGVKPLIIHKFRTKRLWSNIVLAIFYIAVWPITFIIVVIELIHFLFAKKQKNRNGPSL